MYLKETSRRLFVWTKDLINKKVWIFFLVILILGLYLRFYRIESNFGFGWDQARDSWVAREIVNGQYPLVGPRTGVGHFRIGPAYFYLIAPFYYFTNLDPMATNYFNILSNIINFFLIFYVFKKLSDNYTALFVITIYAFNSYVIGINQIPWNVTLMPGIAALILYALSKVLDQQFKWIFLVAFLTGFYFQLHFTAVFIPIIIAFSLVFVKNKLKLLKYLLLSLPLFLVWFIPNIIFELQHSSMNYFKMREFFESYYNGFHFRFLLHQAHNAFIMFELILNKPINLVLIIGQPILYLILVYFDKDFAQKKLAYLISLWFIIPLICITTYGGPLSEYYFLYSLPMTIFTIAYVSRRLIKIRFPFLAVVLAIYWGYYIYANTANLWVKKTQGGLAEQKLDAIKLVERNAGIKYEEGDIKAYLYAIWTKNPEKTD